MQNAEVGAQGGQGEAVPVCRAMRSKAYCRNDVPAHCRLSKETPENEAYIAMPAKQGLGALHVFEMQDLKDHQNKLCIGNESENDTDSSDECGCQHYPG